MVNQAKPAFESVSNNGVTYVRLLPFTKPPPWTMIAAGNRPGPLGVFKSRVSGIPPGRENSRSFCSAANAPVAKRNISRKASIGEFISHTGLPGVPYNVINGPFSKRAASFNRRGGYGKALGRFTVGDARVWSQSRVRDCGDSDAGARHRGEHGDFFGGEQRAAQAAGLPRSGTAGDDRGNYSAAQPSVSGAAGERRAFSHMAEGVQIVRVDGGDSADEFESDGRGACGAAERVPGVGESVSCARHGASAGAIVSPGRRPAGTRSCRDSERRALAAAVSRRPWADREKDSAGRFSLRGGRHSTSGFPFSEGPAIGQSCAAARARRPV